MSDLTAIQTIGTYNAIDSDKHSISVEVGFEINILESFISFQTAVDETCTFTALEYCKPKVISISKNKEYRTEKGERASQKCEGRSKEILPIAVSTFLKKDLATSRCNLLSEK